MKRVTICVECLKSEGEVPGNASNSYLPVRIYHDHEGDHPLYSGCTDSCNFPNCGKIDRLSCGSGGLSFCSLLF